MPEVDEVEYKGITFRRYPESDNRADRCYYRPSGDEIKDGTEALHREVWKDENDADEIPDGHHIHHKDGDPTNNTPENLECVTPKEHAERHPELNLNPEDIEKGFEAAKEWHRSNEGREWHQEHWENTLGKLFKGSKTKDCEQCGDKFEYHTSARFCSNACKAKWRRESGKDDETRICEACQQPFTVNKYSEQKSCSRRCAGALVSWSKRVQSGG